MAAHDPAYDVFLSHAGEQKKPIVDAMHTLLRQVPGISVFMDEHSLVAGDAAWDMIVDAAKRASVAVVVLTREFVSKRWPMEELKIFLARHADANDRLVIVPVLPEDEWERFEHVEDLYKENDQPGHGWPGGRRRPEDSTLHEWSTSVKTLVALTCIRGDQEGYFQGKLASRAVDVVVQRLVALGRLPVGFTWQMRVNWQWVHLPAARVDIVGREEEVRQVIVALEGRQKVAVLKGPAGVGKSTIAEKAAWDLCAQGHCTGGAFVIDFAGFLHDESPKAWLASSLNAQLELCEGLTPPKDNSWGSILAWLKTSARGSVLLLLENFEDVTARMSDSGRDSLTRELQEMFSQLTSVSGRFGSTVLLLVGSRYYDYPLIKGAVTVSVEALPLEWAAKLLTNTTSGANVGWGDGLPMQLARLLECHPLSLEIIASFIRVGRCTPQGVVDNMLENGRVAGAVPTGSRRMGMQPLLDHGRISEQWLTSILKEDELRVLAATARFRGSFSAAGAMVVFVGCLSGMDVAGLQESLEGLASLNLLRREGVSASGQRFMMHLLIRDLVLSSSATEADLGLRWLSWMAEHVEGPGQLLLRHVVGGPDQQVGIVKEVMLHEQLNFKEVVLVLREANLQQGHSRLLTNLQNMGAAMLTLGNLPGARQMLEAVLQKQQQVLGTCHPHTLNNMNLLGCTMKEQGDLVGARRLHEAVLRKRQLLLSENHPSTLTSMNNLALTMREQGDLAGARQLQELVLQKREQLLGENHRDMLGIMGNLAGTMCEQGDLAGARRLRETVLRKQQQVLGEDHPDMLSSMSNMAASMYLQGDLAGARQLQEATLRMQQQVLGEDHPTVLTNMCNLADTMREQGELVGARQLHEAALRKHQQLLGEDHPNTLTTMFTLGRTMREQGDLAGARQLLDTVLQKRQLVLGEDHPHTLINMYGLSVVMREQGDLASARPLQEALLRKQQQLLGEDHPDTLNSMFTLACTMRAQGDVAGARQMQEGALRMQRQALDG